MDWSKYGVCKLCGSHTGKPCINVVDGFVMSYAHASRALLPERERFLVTLEVEIPAVGSVVDDYGSTQNGPEKWNWNKMLRDGDDYNISHLHSMKIK